MRDKVRSCAKWILSGEHTVLRGGSSLLFPLKNFYFEVTYQESKHPLNVQVNSVNTDWAQKDSENFFKNIIIKAFNWAGNKNPLGLFCLKYYIPIAAGLGSSAALCVSLAKTFYQQGWILKDDILKLAMYLENDIHGKSSGGDIQVVYHEKPILFKNFNDIEFVSLKWSPVFKLHFSGILSDTRRCIQKVNDFIAKDPEKGRSVDEAMKESVRLSVEALRQERKTGLLLLQQSMEMALKCFDEWQLCSKELQTQIQDLKSQGAFAVKPTGAGGGGFLLSLWQEPVDVENSWDVQV